MTSTNFSSLEDCHTNVFLLTELNGLKWARYTSSVSFNTGYYHNERITYEDPILQSYARCMREGLLVAWRRVPVVNRQALLSTQPSATFSLDAQKELWLFWYNNSNNGEPEANLLVNLKEEEKGNWESPGINYQTRCMLFKALHNLIERNLFVNGYFRLQKWFVEPLDGAPWLDESDVASRGAAEKFVQAFRFRFFLHGENQVCVSVDVQRLPPLYRLSASTWNAARSGTTPTEVLLFPIGFTGVLTGQECRVDDLPSGWLDWCQFFPLADLESNCVPRLVEINVAGILLKWPSAFVGFVGDTSQKNATVVTPAQFSSGDHLPSPHQNGTSSSGCNLAAATHQDLVSGAQGQFVGGALDDGSEFWEFRDPSLKSNCGCQQRAAKSFVPSKAQLKFGGLAGFRGQKQAYHRRSPLLKDVPRSVPAANVQAFGVSSVGTTASVPAQSLESVFPSSQDDVIVIKHEQAAAPPSISCAREDFSTRALSPVRTISERPSRAQTPEHCGSSSNVELVVRPELVGSEVPPVNLRRASLPPTFEEAQSTEEDIEVETTLSYDAKLQAQHPEQLATYNHHEQGLATSVLAYPFREEPSVPIVTQHNALEPSASLPEDFMEDGYGPSHQVLSPPPSTEQQHDKDDERCLEHPTAVFSGGHAHLPSSVGAAHAAGPDYSKIFPTPPSADSCDHLPLDTVYECPVLASFLEAANFSVYDFLPQSRYGGKRRRLGPTYCPVKGSLPQLYPAVMQPPSFVQHNQMPASLQPAIYPNVASVGTPRNDLGNFVDMSPAAPMSVISRTPGSVGLQSPASNASFRNQNSVESASHQVEGHGLALVLLLSDSFLNHYTDASYDSCTLCACDMDLVGWEAGQYSVKLSPYCVNPLGSKPCECGFSAVRSRYLSARSGMFFEDELDATGVWNAPRSVSKRPVTCLVDMVRERSLVDSEPSRARGEWPSAENQMAGTINISWHLRRFELEYNDFQLLSAMAFEKSMLLPDWQTRSDFKGKRPKVHAWGFLSVDNADGAENESLHVVKKLLPCLQKSLQKPRGNWEAKHAVEGPLTWRCFHRRCFVRLSGKEERSEPEPVAPLIAATERDYVSAPASTFLFWDKLLMEPYAASKDIAYVVVAPHEQNNNYLWHQVSNYFKELSKLYENCGLGRHCPIKKVLRDGIIRVDKRHALQVQTGDVDPWFDSVQNPTLGVRLKLYAQVCKHLLALHLGKESLDASLFREQAPETSDGAVTDPTEGSSESALPPSDSPPVVVVYMVNPWPDQKDLAKQGLNRCFTEILNCLPAASRASFQLQIIELDTILNPPEPIDLKCLAFSVYQQARTVAMHRLAQRGHSLTGFGPASNSPTLSETIVGVTTPLYVLWEGSGFESEPKDVATVLFLNYCLSENQEWLLATCTDQLGLLLDSNVLNMRVDNRRCAVRNKVIAQTIRRLWDYVITVLAGSARPWRLVIGRIGRLGLGELRAWISLLSNKGLKNSSRLIRDRCALCPHLPASSETPAILSACLVSFEAEEHLRVFPQAFAHDSGKTGSTLEDTSVTHVLVFPTSATAQNPAAHSAAVPSAGMENEDPFPADFGLPDLLCNDEMSGLFDTLGTGLSMDTMLDEQDKHHGENNPFSMHEEQEQQDENIQQQPLALGYYVSTAPAHNLPGWFWSQCARWASSACPVHLKSALHINTNMVQQSDELFHSRKAAVPHALDSHLTTDVLRYVLEKYNALSWLNVDPSSGTRRSCLPVHVQALLRLNKSLERLL